MKVYVNISAQYVGDHCFKAGINDVPKELEGDVKKVHGMNPTNFDIVEEPKKAVAKKAVKEEIEKVEEKVYNVEEEKGKKKSGKSKK